MSPIKLSSILRNQDGMGMIGSAVIALGVVVGGSIYVIKSRDASQKGVSLEVKEVRAKTDAQKVLSLGGYLVSSNFVACKQESWKSDTKKLKCRWHGKHLEKDYDSSEFGLSGLRYENDYLTFDLNKSVFNRTGVVKFKLVDVNESEELKTVFGNVDSDSQVIDKDHYVVLVEAKVDYKLEDGSKKNIGLVGAFKRPISIPEITILGSSCVSQCNSSISENPHVSCRGPQSIDVNTVSEITGYTRNQGPGMLYHLTYERAVDFSTQTLTTTTSQTVSRSTGAVLNSSSTTTTNSLGADLPPSPVEIQFDDFLMPGSTVEWTDEVPCAQFVQNSQSPQADGTVSQHSQDAGKVIYRLDANSDHSNIEPFRLSSKIIEFEDGFKGKLKINYVPVQVIHTH
ncbi:MAG: hypothetical protein KC493_16170 [Bacteriovoracaceae bacterium]|nr:hypothetical protein [Bacteriovoracaceae bacterium]